jgi:hypothetical protein
LLPFGSGLISSDTADIFAIETAARGGFLSQKERIYDDISEHKRRFFTTVKILLLAFIINEVKV